jgi:hypothetical protein
MTETGRSTPADEQAAEKICGIVMPIAAFGDYSSDHWLAVRDILSRAATMAGMRPEAVWEGGATDVIHGRIVYNLFSHDIVIADVSGLNPNVMFELGMRMTYGKPTVLVADETTNLPFDTRAIEHLIYLRSLPFHSMEGFMNKLSERLGVVSAASDRGDYKSFVESFGKIKVVEPETESVSVDQALLERLDRIEVALQRAVPNRVTPDERIYRFPARDEESGRPVPSANIVTRNIIMQVPESRMEEASAELSSIAGVSVDDTTAPFEGIVRMHLQVFGPSPSYVSRKLDIVRRLERNLAAPAQS